MRRHETHTRAAANDHTHADRGTDGGGGGGNGDTRRSPDADDRADTASRTNAPPHADTNPHRPADDRVYRDRTVTTTATPRANSSLPE